jgi:hypothetical protein
MSMPKNRSHQHSIEHVFRRFSCLPLHAMTREDLKAMHAYVNSLGAAGEVAPSYVPPEQEPVGLAVQFPMAAEK